MDRAEQDADEVRIRVLHNVFHNFHVAIDHMFGVHTVGSENPIRGRRTTGGTHPAISALYVCYYYKTLKSFPESIEATLTSVDVEGRSRGEAGF